MNEPTSVINSPAARPGRLKGGATIYLHSFYAIRAFQGRAKTRTKPRIFGADEFNSRTNLLYRACEADDPFAHYALVQIERALADEEHTLRSDIRSARKYLNKQSGRIRINDAMSVDPVKFLVHYAHYGFQLVDLLVRFDELCQLLLSGAHCNRIPKQEARDWMEKAATRMRVVMAVATGYRYTTVTRSDLNLQTKMAKKGVDKLIDTKFIDPRTFTGFNDICQIFASYNVELIYGPQIKSADESNNVATSDDGEDMEVDKIARFKRQTFFQSQTQIVFKNGEENALTFWDDYKGHQ